MNKRRYNLDRIRLYVAAVPMTVISLFIRRDKRRIIFTSFLNRKFNSNSKYLFLWFLKNVSNYKSYFVVNDDALRNKLNMEIGNYFVETKTFAGKLFALRAGLWVLSALEIPVGGFFMSFRRRVIHLDHGAPMKNSGLLEKNVSLLKRLYYLSVITNISFICATSNYFKPIVSKIFGLPANKILVAGHARNDQLFVKSALDINTLVKTPGKNVLYAPTWRQSSNVRLFCFGDFSYQRLADFLLENDINIFIRIHPNFEDEMDAELLKIPNIYLFSGRKYDEIMDYMNLFDLLITDYSSIHYDYLLLDRPIIFLPYDYKEYEQEIGFAVPYHDFTPGYKPATMKEFFLAILASLDQSTDEYKEERKRVNTVCNAFQRDNCKGFVKLLRERKILEDMSD